MTATASRSSFGVRWDAALVLSLALLAGSLCSANRVATCLVALCLFALTFRRLSQAVWLSAVVCFGVSAWRGQVRVDDFEREWSHVRQALGAPKRCMVEGHVQRSPVWRGDALSFTAVLRHAECEGKVLPAPLIARLYGGPRTLARGDAFEATTQLGVVRLFRNLDLSDPTLGMARHGVTLSGSILALDTVDTGDALPSLIDRARAHVRGRIEATFAGPAVGMAKALVLGENDLTEEEDLAFRQSGLAHLLAVSGTHLVFAVVSLVTGLRFLLVRIPALAERTHVERWACLGGAFLALLYADFAGGSGSAWRAAWMLAAAFLMRASDFRPNVTRAVAASVVVGVWLDPLAVFDLSFMLSLAATAGLLTLGQRWARPCERIRPRPVRLFALGTVATLSSILPCSVLLALLSPFVSLPGIVMNVLAAPFGEVVALPLCLSHALLSPFPALEYGTAQVASGALLVVKQAAFISTHLVEWFPVLGLPLPMPSAGHVAVLVLGVAVGCLPRHRPVGSRPGRRAAVIGIATALGFLLVEAKTRHDSQREGELRVSALDVGQGDATFVDLPDGKTMLIDAGGFVGSPVDPGERVILPLLRARRVTHIDVVVLSHPHPDHFGGLLSVVRSATVGEFWDTGQGKSEGAGPVYQALLDELAARGVPVKGPSELCGTHSFGGAGFDVLGPCPSVIPGRNANDNSWVIRVRHGRRAVLFTGDAEAHQEQELLERSRSLLRADLLKVGHHGSRTSTTKAFLAAVSPRFATLSCGVRNRYGHPHAVTLETLAAQGVTALRLDDLGGVEWRTDGEQVFLDAYALH